MPVTRRQLLNFMKRIERRLDGGEGWTQSVLIKPKDAMSDKRFPRKVAEEKNFRYCLLGAIFQDRTIDENAQAFVANEVMPGCVPKIGTDPRDILFFNDKVGQSFDNIEGVLRCTRERLESIDLDMVNRYRASWNK